MLRNCSITAVFCCLWLSGCATSNPKVHAAAPRPDSTGMFVDACHLLIDSVKIEKDRIFTYDGEFPSEYMESERAGDTVFYAGGIMAIIRRKSPLQTAGNEWFFGYNHRGDRFTWDRGMFVQVRPSKEVAEGWAYARGEDYGNLLTCVQGARMQATGQRNPSEPADRTLYDFPPNLTVGSLERFASLKERYLEMEIDWRELPELSYKAGMENLEEKLREVNQTNIVQVKHFYAIGMEHGLWFIPLYRVYLEHMRLTHQELLDLGATLKVGSDKKR